MEKRYLKVEESYTINNNMKIIHNAEYNGNGGNYTLLDVFNRLSTIVKHCTPLAYNDRVTNLKVERL